MTNTCLAIRPEDGPSDRQRSMRRRIGYLPFGKAVGFAANAFFRFKYRAIKAAALWSNSTRAWLGRETFLDWALCDSGIDIPWVVAEAAGAPLAMDELREAVRAELISYWKRKLATLPPEENPAWLPLP